MAKNTGKQFEQFVESIYQALTKDERFTTVERDVMLEGKDGPRQIDVLLRSEVANINLLTVIECRDYNKRLSITHLDGLHSKLQDVNASKGVLVSRKGFSSTAKQKASRVGITLCLASDAGSVLNEIKEEIPIKIRHVRVGIEANFDIRFLKKKASFSIKDVIFNELKFFDKIRDQILEESYKLSDNVPRFRISTKKLNLPFTVKDSSGNEIAIITEKVKMKLKLGFEYYYGHLSDLPDLNSMHQYESDSTIFFLKAQDYPKMVSILPRMTEFKTENEIPPNYRIQFNLIDFKIGGLLSDSIENNAEDMVIKVKRQKK